MENRISISIDQNVLEEIQESIQAIANSLPDLVTLTANEKRTMLKMGDKSVAFVNKALELARQNPEITPLFLNTDEFEIDVHAVNHLTKVFFPLHQLVEKLEDTVMLAGSEAYTAALIFYNAAKGAAKVGLPGSQTVYDELKERFPGANRKKEVPANNGTN